MKVIELHESVTASNDHDADVLREKMKADCTLLINLMSSPGSGKTTLLKETVKAMPDVHIAVMEADIASDVDAVTMAQNGAESIQVHTDGMCHMDAGMTAEGLRHMNLQGIDLVFLENVGNLICPAEFDTGAGKNVMILSVPEGDDKPLKYPLMFSKADALVISKMDTAAYFDFSLEKCMERVKRLNPDIVVFPLSAKTGEGMDAWCGWLKDQVQAWKKGEQK